MTATDRYQCYYYRNATDATDVFPGATSATGECYPVLPRYRCYRRILLMLLRYKHASKLSGITMKYRQAIRELSRAGWVKIRKSATSHAIWKRGKERLIISEHDPLPRAAIVAVRKAIC